LVKFAPDGKTVLAAGVSSFYIFDLQDGKAPRALPLEGYQFRD
jgi:hypothetical protein